MEFTGQYSKIMLTELSLALIGFSLIAPLKHRKYEVFWELRCNRNGTQFLPLRSIGLIYL